MPTIHDAHAAMFGLARHGELYERWAGRLAGRLYARVTADLLNAALPLGRGSLTSGSGPASCPCGSPPPVRGGRSTRSTFPRR